MITANSIQQLGYTQRQSYNIMQMLKKLGCNATSLKQRSNYVRNGVICDYLHFCDAIDTKEALELLGGYMQRLPKEANREKWESILSDLQNMEIITQNT